VLFLKSILNDLWLARFLLTLHYSTYAIDYMKVEFLILPNGHYPMNVKKPRSKPVRDFFKKQFQKKGFVKAYETVGPLMDVALAIADARCKAGLSQGELAKKLHTTQSVVSRIENGNQNISLKMLVRVAHVLNCELSLKMKPLKLAA